jgi:hypothetical protein
MQNFTHLLYRRRRRTTRYEDHFVEASVYERLLTYGGGCSSGLLFLSLAPTIARFDLFPFPPRENCRDQGDYWATDGGDQGTFRKRRRTSTPRYGGEDGRPAV